MVDLSSTSIFHSGWFELDRLPSNCVSSVKVSNTIIFRVEEIPALACPNLPGIWVTVAGLGEGGKEAPILVGILSCDQDLEDSTFEETLSEVVVKARERLSQDVAIVVGGNRALQRSSSSPIGLQSLTWSRPGPSQFLLHSPQLPLEPEPLAKLGELRAVLVLTEINLPNVCRRRRAGLHFEDDGVSHL